MKLHPDAVRSPCTGGSGKGNKGPRWTPGCNPVTQLTAPVSEPQGMAGWSGVSGLVSLKKDFIMITECLKKEVNGRCPLEAT